MIRGADHDETERGGGGLTTLRLIASLLRVLLSDFLPRRQYRLAPGQRHRLLVAMAGLGAAAWRNIVLAHDPDAPENLDALVAAALELREVMLEITAPEIAGRRWQQRVTARHRESRHHPASQGRPRHRGAWHRCQAPVGAPARARDGPPCDTSRRNAPNAPGPMSGARFAVGVRMA